MKLIPPQNKTMFTCLRWLAWVVVAVLVLIALPWMPSEDPKE